MYVFIINVVADLPEPQIIEEQLQEEQFSSDEKIGLGMSVGVSAVKNKYIIKFGNFRLLSYGQVLINNDVSDFYFLKSIKFPLKRGEKDYFLHHIIFLAVFLSLLSLIILLTIFFPNIKQKPIKPEQVPNHDKGGGENEQILKIFDNLS
jgi:hypothetical protein